ncbi:MAG: hypothetical protein R3B40_23725 [Polyangiales bacterium]|nr:hypothetical protein [Myxococcales bacterium]MCB9661032.1 hypothetical protein [Sandaracinaceae bacterium]
MSTTSARPSRACARVLNPLRVLQALTLSAALVAGCGSPSPAPDYPTPEDPAVEDTEFADVLGLNEDEEAEAEEPAEDDWVDPSAGDGAAEKR